MAGEGWIEAKRDGGGLTLAAGGRWLVTAAAALDAPAGGARSGRAGAQASRPVRIDCAKIEALDTVGAWLILRLKAALGRGAGRSLDRQSRRALRAASPPAEKLTPDVPQPLPRRPAGLIDALAAIGRSSSDAIGAVAGALGFFGIVVITALATLRHPRRIRFVAFVSQMQRTGASALPIVGLLSFLIGVVIAYQGADQLRYYGAEIFTVNLLGIGFLRELGVLLTAIIVAGRSGSAFTAEIGTMQVNEEIDAMTTLGLDPVEVLVLPRLGALVVTLPLLTFYANVMGLLGGAFICDLALGIPLPALSSAAWRGNLRLEFLAWHY